MFKEQKGVTLIALVITIIVLLILAGVSIAFLIGDNGIITKSTKASAETNIAGAKETAATDVAAKYADYMEYKYASNTTNPGAADTFTAWLGTNKLTSTDTTKYTVSEDSLTITIVPRNNANEQKTGTIKDTGAIQWDD